MAQHCCGDRERIGKKRRRHGCPAPDASLVFRLRVPLRTFLVRHLFVAPFDDRRVGGPKSTECGFAGLSLFHRQDFGDAKAEPTRIERMPLP